MFEFHFYNKFNVCIECICTPPLVNEIITPICMVISQALVSLIFFHTTNIISGVEKKIMKQAPVGYIYISSQTK